MLNLPEDVPARPVGALRIIVGAAASFKALQWTLLLYFGDRPPKIAADALEGLTPGIAVYTVLGLSWLVASIAMMVGYGARVASLLTGVLTFVVMFAAGYYSNHLYLMTALASLLAFTHCGAALSLDARRSGERQLTWAPPVYLLRVQISVVYFYAAAGKVNFDFLSGNALASWAYDAMLVPDFMRVAPLLVAMAVGTVVLEFFIAFALWIPRLRLYAMAIGLVLHLGMVVWISRDLAHAARLLTFAVMMFGGYLVFLEELPAPLRKVLSRAPGRRSAVAVAARPDASVVAARN